LIGVDISTKAITSLRARRPTLSDNLIVGDLSALPPSTKYDLVIGIQVFQHGTRVEAHQHLGAAAARVSAHGLLCVRVNATETDVEHTHDRVEEDADDGSFTVRYRSGPKAGLAITSSPQPSCAQSSVAGSSMSFLPDSAPPREPHPAAASGHSGKPSGVTSQPSERHHACPQADRLSVTFWARR
jgi:hypothetical protein